MSDQRGLVWTRFHITHLWGKLKVTHLKTSVCFLCHETRKPLDTRNDF